MPRTAENWGQLVVLIAAVLGAAQIIWRKAIKPIVNGMNRLVQVIAPDEEGLTLPERMDRLEDVLHKISVELHPNGGNSLRDQVDNLGKQLEGLYTYTHDFKHDMLDPGGVIALEHDTFMKLTKAMQAELKRTRAANTRKDADHERVTKAETVRTRRRS